MGTYGSDTEVEDDALAAMGEDGLVTPEKKLRQKRARTKKAATGKWRWLKYMYMKCSLELVVFGEKNQ